MRDVLLHSGLKNRKRIQKSPVRSVPKKTGRISSTVWISPGGKVMDEKLRQLSAPNVIVYRDRDYSIERVMYGNVAFYNILKDGESLAENRDSIEEAKKEIAEFRTHGDNVKEWLENWHPSAKEALESKTDIRGADLDKPIIPLIKKLNALGYDTAWSCAGHVDDNESRNGFITFSKRYDIDGINKIRQILINSGIKDIKDGYNEEQKRTIFWFKRVE